MPSDPLFKPDGHEPSVRAEIAAAAARLIADSALDYGSAKIKAAQLVGASASLPRHALPDNDDIDLALLSHLRLFDEEHDERVRRRREVALELMTLLAPFEPMITGSVWKGIVAEHAPIHLQAFADSAKDLAIDLLNHNIRYDSVTMPHISGRGEAEALAFYWRNEPVIVSAYDHRERRTAARKGNRAPERGTRQALLARMQS